MRYSAQTIIYDLSRLAPDTRKLILKTPKFRKWFSQKPDSMLRLDGSTKVIKGNKLGYRTAILYLAPANMSGVNVCPMAKLAACADACLNTSGRGAMTGVQMSRLRKTLFWLQYQQEAVALIKSEIRMFEARAKKQGWTLLVRLNGTSNLRFENYGIVQSYPNVQFYDYTKLANRKNARELRFDVFLFRRCGLSDASPIGLGGRHAHGDRFRQARNGQRHARER
jgi:hypothetical protein